MAIGKAWVNPKALGLGLLLVGLCGCGAGLEETKDSETPALPEPSPDDMAEPPPDGRLLPPGGVHGDSSSPAVAMGRSKRPQAVVTAAGGTGRARNDVAASPYLVLV